MSYFWYIDMAWLLQRNNTVHVDMTLLSSDAIPLACAGLVVNFSMRSGYVGHGKISAGRLLTKVDAARIVALISKAARSARSSIIGMAEKSFRTVKPLLGWGAAG